jgi:hypothetical protein
MKILVTAKYVSGNAREGGSSRFMKCLADVIIEMGHKVILSDRPMDHVEAPYDLIICSHGTILDTIKPNSAPKICISHGVIGDEILHSGADRYVSISEEVQGFNRLYGIDSEIIGQPIKMNGQFHPGKELKKILYIRSNNMERNSFAFLSGRYEIRQSKFNKPIEDQIAWADLCIGLGRGALEAMGQGKPVLVADNREYIGAFGDGYVNKGNIKEIARCNFSGRRFRIPITREWIEAELAKYNVVDSDLLYNYVLQNHEAHKIALQYLGQKYKFKMSFGVLINDQVRLDMVLRQSEIKGDMHYINKPESATKGLNKLLAIMEDEGSEIAVLCHQDMFFRQDWITQVNSQLVNLPDSWIVAGVIGKDMKGRICGRMHDTRIPQHFDTSDIHEFPHPASCFDECVIIVNLKKKFRFDEGLDGFDLYGTLCVLQTWEMGGTAWIIDAFCEHFCLRPFTWFPDESFEKNYKWLYEKFKKMAKGRLIHSTAIGKVQDEPRFETSAA